MSDLRVKGSWGGFGRGRFIELTDGSKWRQIDDYYEWRFAHRPQAAVESDMLTVKGMKRPVKVERIK